MVQIGKHLVEPVLFRNAKRLIKLRDTSTPPIYGLGI